MNTDNNNNKANPILSGPVSAPIQSNSPINNGLNDVPSYLSRAALNRISGISTPGFYNKLYANPLFDYLGEYLPTDIKKLFAWAEHVYFNTPVIANAIKKYINYPVTDIVYESPASDVRDRTKYLLENILNIKSHLIEVGTDYLIYGNAFRSISFPTVKFVKCKNTKCELHEHGINANTANIRTRGSKLQFFCPSCKSWVYGEFNEMSIMDINKISIIRWNPHTIDIKYNDISGDIFHYYNIPSGLQQSIKTGDRDILLTTPKLFLDAVQSNNVVKFGSNFIHIKAPSIAGMFSGWGISPLAHTLKMYLYMAILRKSNEAIALDQITPKNILYPQGTTSDPAMASSMADWRKNITSALDRWKTDPNFIMTAPYPTGVVNIGSQGKGLLVNEHILDAEQNMVRALDIPTELIYGTTNINNSGVTLRLLENQLIPYTSQLVRYVNWLIDTINNFFNTDYCHINFSPFRLSDDVFKQQLLTSLVGNVISKSSYQAALGLDTDRERERIIQESVDDTLMQREIEKQVNAITNTIAQQAQQEAEAQQQQLSMPQYNQQALIAQADELALQIAQTPEEARDQEWAKLQQSDYIMYALVKARTEQLRTSMRAQGAAMLSQQNMQQAGTVGGNNGTAQ